MDACLSRRDLLKRAALGAVAMAGGNLAAGAVTIHAAQAANSGDVVLTNGKFVDGRGQVATTLTVRNGRIVSVGRVADGPYVPVRLEVDGNTTLVAGSVVEVWLAGEANVEAISIPLNAIMEHEGRFFCYVQTAGETMEKRWIELGRNDGLRAQVMSGLAAGERVVTIGGVELEAAESFLAALAR